MKSNKLVAKSVVRFAVRARTFGRRRLQRRGSIVVLGAVLMIVIFALVAVGVDLGYVCLVRGELQRSADASALAGASALYRNISSTELYEYNAPSDIVPARLEAQRLGKLNGAGPYRWDGQFYTDLNLTNAPDGDIVVGRFTSFREPFIASESDPNALQVQLRLATGHPNGPLPLFFARAFGADSTEMRATATAAIVEYPLLLPITASVDLWNSTEHGSDLYSIERGEVAKGPDGIPELTVYPGEWDGAGLPPGNFGALQIGPESGSPVLRRQVNAGPNEGDFAYHGGSLYDGIELPGSTGLKADVETALTGGPADGKRYRGVLGAVRFLPLYIDATGHGQNATFTITKFVSVRIVAANLKGNPKAIVIQPVSEAADLRYKTALVE